MRNSGLKFVSKTIDLTVETEKSVFTNGYRAGDTLRIPVAHHDGNYVADASVAARLVDEDRVAFRYSAPLNGSVKNIAGILSENRRVLGMMPHPERAIDASHGGTDGQAMFRALVEATVAA
jgi:phosphoribosylformylglycinamidine synthase